jgi:hypothetical protein
MKRMRPNSIYKPHPAIAYGQTVVRNLEAKHSKSVEEFSAELAGVLRAERSDYLKRTYGMGASAVMNLVSAIDGELNGETYDPDADVEAMFGGKREWMRPIFDEVLGFTLSLGEDVWVSPCQKFVPFYRGQKFAEIHSETNTRLRLYVLVDQEFSGFGPVPPRVDKYNACRDLGSIADVDDAVRGALRRAYELKEGAKFPWGLGSP